jgi:hypothetical protein
MKVAIEVAEKEVTAWLDYKRVKESVREEKKEAIAELVKCVSDGDLVINQDTFEIEHALLFPIENEISTTKLFYKPRVNADKIQVALKGIKSDDLHGMLLAYGAAISNNPKKLIAALDTEDYKIMQKVAVFFM